MQVSDKTPVYHPAVSLSRCDELSPPASGPFALQEAPLVSAVKARLQRNVPGYRRTVAAAIPSDVLIRMLHLREFTSCMKTTSCSVLCHCISLNVALWAEMEGLQLARPAAGFRRVPHRSHTSTNTHFTHFTRGLQSNRRLLLLGSNLSRLRVFFPPRHLDGGGRLPLVSAALAGDGESEAVLSCYSLQSTPTSTLPSGAARTFTLTVFTIPTSAAPYWPGVRPAAVAGSSCWRTRSEE